MPVEDALPEKMTYIFRVSFFLLPTRNATPELWQPLLLPAVVRIASPRDSYVKVLTLNVTVFGDKALRM